MATKSEARLKLPKLFQKLKISELKEELTKRGITNLKGIKPDLQKRLFEVIRISSTEINHMSRDEVVEELKSLERYRGLMKWSTDDLKKYLRHVYRDMETYISYQHRTTNFDVEKIDDHTVSRDVFDTMPLFKLQDKFGFKRTEIDRKQMYETCKQRIKDQKESRSQQKQLMVDPIKRHFFAEDSRSERLKLLPKEHFSGSKEKLLVLLNLNTDQRKMIHKFVEKHGLYSTSVGQDNPENKQRKTIGVSRSCDKNELRTELSKFETAGH